jgi:hypothetical protein
MKTRGLKAPVLALYLWAMTPFQSHADTFSVLSLGNRQDAKTWAEGLRKLGLTPGREIISGTPTTEEIKSFFGRSDDWLFIAGHFTDHLYNDAKTVEIWFQPNGVRIVSSGTETLLTKTSGFLQHQHAKVLFWGGCSVHYSDASIKLHRQLFGRTTTVGWKSLTGWEILDINLGGKGNGASVQSPNFFSILNGSSDSSKVRDAWLKAADGIYWGQDSEGNPYRPRFSVVDPGGQEYVLTGNIQPNKGYQAGRKLDQ